MHIDADVLLAARLSSASYSMDPENTRWAVEDLGCEFVAQVFGDSDSDGDAECVAVVCRHQGRQIVAMQGTRVSENLSVDGLLRDINIIRQRTEFGMVMRGFWNPLKKTWPKIAAHLDLMRPAIITGHSLGGVQAHLIPALCYCSRVISFGAPAGATARVWRNIYTESGPVLTRVVNANDFAPGWPWIDGIGVDFVQPHGDMVWFHDGTADIVSTRPALNLSVKSHDVSLYVKKVAALVA